MKWWENEVWERGYHPWESRTKRNSGGTRRIEFRMALLNMMQRCVVTMYSSLDDHEVYVALIEPDGSLKGYEA